MRFAWAIHASKEVHVEAGIISHRSKLSMGTAIKAGLLALMHALPRVNVPVRTISIVIQDGHC
jgi:hypothetical protein